MFDISRFIYFYDLIDSESRFSIFFSEPPLLPYYLFSIFPEKSRVRILLNSFGESISSKLCYVSWKDSLFSVIKSKPQLTKMHSYFRKRLYDSNTIFLRLFLVYLRTSFPTQKRLIYSFESNQCFTIIIVMGSCSIGKEKLQPKRLTIWHLTSLADFKRNIFEEEESKIEILEMSLTCSFKVTLLSFTCMLLRVIFLTSQIFIIHIIN